MINTSGQKKRLHHRAGTLRALLLTGILSLGALAAGAVHADVTVEPGKQYWVNSRGGTGEPSYMGNTFTGSEFGMRFNSWAAFYIPFGTYTSATLSITPSYYGNPGPSRIGLYDVTTPFDVLLRDFAPGKNAYLDLGSGRQYAAVTLLDQPVTVTLNARALADLNAKAGGYFMIGFTNETLNALPLTMTGNGIYLSGMNRGATPLRLNLTQ